MTAIILYICLTVSSASPTMPYSLWGFWTLNSQNAEVVAFVDETCKRWDVESKQVTEVLAEDYFYRVKYYKPKTKANREKALRHMLEWCRYWRDSSYRLRLNHDALAKYSKAECFFRSLERKSYGY